MTLDLMTTFEVRESGGASGEVSLATRLSARSSIDAAADRLHTSVDGIREHGGWAGLPYDLVAAVLGHAADHAAQAFGGNHHPSGGDGHDDAAAASDLLRGE